MYLLLKITVIYVGRTLNDSSIVIAKQINFGRIKMVD